MSLEPRMLNQKDACKYMKTSRGKFLALLMRHGYGGVRYDDGAAILYDRKVLDNILDSLQPTPAQPAAMFDAHWNA